MKKNQLKFLFVDHKKFFYSTVAVAMFSLISCSGDGSPKIKEGEVTTVMEPTKGTITEVEEVQPGNDFKIIDEQVIDKRENSKAIVHLLNGKTDTLSLQKLNSGENHHGYGSALRGVLLYSLAASFFNRNMANTSPNSGYYKNQAAFDKSNGLKSDMEKTATRRKVTVPKKASTGYGSGRSFRSHGG